MKTTKVDIPRPLLFALGVFFLALPAGGGAASSAPGFAAVKQVGADFQSNLGERKGQLGINLIGAMDENDNRATGWQLRVYGAQDSAKGANVGVFHRRINDGALVGGSAFADYEDGDYGGFVRLGIGGEVRQSFMDIAANYYLPLTGEQHVNATVAAFSRQGYDAEVRIAAPGFSALKMAVDYYNFRGKLGAAKVKGFRYGMELRPFAGFRFAAFYDDGAEKTGGEISYTHPLGIPQKPRNNQYDNATSNLHSRTIGNPPGFHAPASREYSQRITTNAQPQTSP